MGDELATLDATASAEMVRQGEVSPAELVEAAIERIEKLNGDLNAVITPLYEKARAAVAAGLPDGPFRGVPFLLKDLDTLSAGDPFHGGMKLLKRAGYIPDHSSYLVEKFRAAGLVALGKTNTPELGLDITTEPEAYGPSCNPWNPGWRPAWCRSPTPATAAGRSGSRRASVAWWGSSRRAVASRWAPSTVSTGTAS
ncbi:MAG: hypothetical protein JRS35_19145 [Deltaproteobacteria bacterium]|nr:hypothetical protein [Deltaproteobacteria bacterium]